MKIPIGGAILFCLGWLVWPYYALYDLSNALKTGDQVGIERRIEWETVRQGLRDDLHSALLQRLARDQRNSNHEAGAALGVGLAAVLAPVFVDRLIDSFVTSSSVVAIIQKGKLSRPDQPLSQKGAAAQAQTQQVSGKDDRPPSP